MPPKRDGQSKNKRLIYKLICLAEKLALISLFGRTEGLLKNKLADPHSHPKPDWDFHMVHQFQSDSTIKSSMDSLT